MNDIDTLFKRPHIPSKRKFEPSPNPSDIYKSTKTFENGGSQSGQRTAVVEEDEEAQDGEDGVAGPNLPLDEEELAGSPDEEGRFFGGGVNRNTAEVLDFIDEQEKQEYTEERIDSAWLRRLALNFEKRISKNAELRAKFENTPQKFMSSEADLDADVKALSILSDHPELFDEFSQLGCVASLVSLIAHDNTDIALDAIEIINELTDEDVEAEQIQWNALVDALLEADLANLIVQNFSRLDESNESDRAGVYHSLAIFENLASQPAISEKLVQNSEALKWLLTRIQKLESPVTQNKQYASEVLAILLQASNSNRLSVISLDGADLLLQLLSAYRKRDPLKDSDEEEFVENLFNCLTCLVEDTKGKHAFVEAEGVELCLIMLREGKWSKPRSLRLLDHALGGSTAVEVCERFVDSAGLKPLFGMYMKHMDHQSTEHILGLIASLLRRLPGESAPRIRTLAKFMEKDYEKIQKLVQVRREYVSRLRPIEAQIAEERSRATSDDVELLEDEWLSRRLDNGLFCLQTADMILAWLVAEDEGARRTITKLLGQDGQDLSILRKTLQEQLDDMASSPAEDETGEKETLTTLLDLCREMCPRPEYFVA